MTAKINEKNEIMIFCVILTDGTTRLQVSNSEEGFAQFSTLCSATHMADDADMNTSIPPLTTSTKKAKSAETKQRCT